MINKHLADHVTESRLSPLFWKFQMGYWIAYMLLQGLAGWTLLVAGIISNGSELVLLELILLKSAYGFLLTGSLRPLLRGIHSRAWHPVRMLPLVVVISLAAVAVEFLLTTRIPYLREHFRLLNVNFSAGTPAVIFGFYPDLFFFALWLGFYFGTSLFIDSMELSHRQQKSELALLRYQLQPHFLFNALTAVMAVSGDRGKVEELTQSLADYLRFSLSKGHEDALPLGEELDALENYLHVEKIRFAENLNYGIDADQEARTFKVPSQLVQPLLENAIKYGQQTGPVPLSIRILARRTGDKLHLAVENTGSWVEPSPSSRDQGMGIGIGNLRRRLQLLYGDRASLTYEYSPEGVRALVTLPIVRP